MKRIFVVGMAGLWAVAGGLFLQACGGDDSVKNDGGTDATIDDTGTGTDTSTGMDADMDGMMMGMDGSTMTDGGGGTFTPNPGKVNCGTMLDCDAGVNGCCIRQQDGGLTFQCVNFGMCANGVRWECDEPADCLQGICCIDTNPFVDKQCSQFCGGGDVRACKKNADCPGDAGTCGTYTCPNNIVIHSCTKPQNCN